MPQALRRMVPPIVSQFISLLKDTSLAVVIALPELIHNAQILNGQSADGDIFPDLSAGGPDVFRGQLLPVSRDQTAGSETNVKGYFRRSILFLLKTFS